MRIVHVTAYTPRIKWRWEIIYERQNKKRERKKKDEWEIEMEVKNKTIPKLKINGRRGRKQQQKRGNVAEVEEEKSGVHLEFGAFKGKNFHHQLSSVQISSIVFMCISTQFYFWFCAAVVVGFGNCPSSLLFLWLILEYHYHAHRKIVNA